MTKTKKPEVWLRGPLEGTPVLLQPIAHALLQAREEVNELMEGFDAKKLSDRPANVASVGFHLQHLTGVLDRLLTYARGEVLTENQLNSLQKEGTVANTPTTLTALLIAFNAQVDLALAQINATAPESLPEVRKVGRAGIPSTVMGLLTHVAEHTMRHVGQLHVTVKIVQAGISD